MVGGLEAARPSDPHPKRVSADRACAPASPSRARAPGSAASRIAASARASASRSADDQARSARARRPCRCRRPPSRRPACPTPAPRGRCSGSPSTLPLSSLHRRDGDDVRRRERCPRPRPATDCRESARARRSRAARARSRSSSRRSPVAGDHGQDRRPDAGAPAAHASIEVLEALLAHEPAGGEHERRASARRRGSRRMVGAQSRIAAGIAPRPRRRARLAACRVGAERDRPRRRGRRCRR